MAKKLSTQKIDSVDARRLRRLNELLREAIDDLSEVIVAPPVASQRGRDNLIDHCVRVSERARDLETALYQMELGNGA